MRHGVHLILYFGRISSLFGYGSILCRTFVLSDAYERYVQRLVFIDALMQTQTCALMRRASRPCKYLENGATGI